MANGGAANHEKLSPFAGVGESLAGAPVAAPANFSLQPGETIRVDRITGNRIIEGGKRRSAFSRLSTEIKLPGTVPGLHAFESPMSLKFVWIRSESIDEADARDAQCRAGWADHQEGHGFFSFETFQREDGLYEATWCCWKSTE